MKQETKILQDLQERTEAPASLHTKEKSKMSKPYLQKKKLEELTLLDRFLFDEVMSDPATAEDVLSIALAEEINNVRVGISEKNLEPYYDSRAVRLDLLIFDEKDAVYDAEAQKRNFGHRNLVRRSRFYQAHIDVNLLPKGEIDFGVLNDVCTVFIAPFDIFGEKKYKYTFRMRCEEDSTLYLEDGATRIFLNTHGRNREEVTEELIEFLEYAEKGILSGKETSEKVQRIADRVEAVKADHEVGVKYMRLWEERLLDRMEAKEEGKAEGENNFAELMQMLFAQGRTADAERAAKNAEYRHQLMKELLSTSDGLDIN